MRHASKRLFRGLRPLSLALGLLGGCPGAGIAADVSLIVGAEVIDGSGAPARPLAVLIRDGRIAEVGDARALRAPPGAAFIDGRGKYLIPGLWDMHAHLLRPGRPEAYFDLLIANGVTGFRDMGTETPLAEVRALRAQVESGRRAGPHFVAAGPLLDGPYPQLPQLSRVVRDAVEARAAVAELQAQGADFVKVYNRLTPEAFFAIAGEARRRGLPFAGHVPFSVSARAASDAGQASMEHLFNLSFACSTREDELMRRKAEALGPGLAGERRRLRREYLRAVLDSFSAARCEALFAGFARNGSWQTPTLAQRRLFAYPQEIPADDPRLRYVPRTMRHRFDPRQDARIGSRDAEDAELQRLHYERDRSLIAPMRRAGVGLLAGSDAGDPFSVPGFSLHEELAALADAGLTPMQALQAATRDAAAFLGRDDFGLIAAGRRADLVLLDADPLVDIRNTRRIAGVMLGGRYWPRQELDRLLQQILARAEMQPSQLRDYASGVRSSSR